MEKSTEHAEPEEEQPKMNLIFDTTKPGLTSILPEYTSKILLALWKAEADPRFAGATSRDAYIWYNEYADIHNMESRSRAAIINELNDMCDRGILEYEDESCKGGSRRRYRPILGPIEFEAQARKELEEALDERIFHPGWWVQEGSPIYE